MPIDPRTVRTILVVKLRAIGDVLLSTIVLPNLRRAFPAARIDFLTEPPAQEIVRRQPAIDEVLCYDRKVESGAGLVRRVRSRSYDMVIDLFGNPRTALLTFLSGARHRVGYRFRGRAYAYTVVVDPRGGEVHNTQFNLDALEAIGVEIVDRNLYFPVAPEEVRFADDVLAAEGLASGLTVALHTGGGWYTKRWPIERFAALADLLVEKHGARVVLPWGPGERGDVEAVQRAMHRPALIAPPTSFGQLAALLSRMSLAVMNDSGPMHLAAAVGTPVLGIFGPTNPRLQGPYGEKHTIVRNEVLPCLGCNLTACPIGHPCMQGLEVGAVLRAAEELMIKNRIRA